MSVTVVAMTGHRLNARGAEALPHTLQSAAASELRTATNALYGFLKPFYPLLELDERWHVQGYHETAISDPATAWARGGAMWIDGPAGLSLGAGQHLYDLGFFVLWTNFLADADARTLVEQVSAALARLLGSPEVLYVPDSAYRASGVSDLEYTDASVDDAKRWLRQHCGPPAERPTQIISPAVEKGYQYDVDTNGYLIARLSEEPQPGSAG